MRSKDTSAINFLKRDAEFADIVNLALFHGEHVINPECLRELDSTEVMNIPLKNQSQKSESVQRYRDVLKSVTLKDRETYGIRLIIGMEEQSEIHYAMPVRNMLYDALNYTRQINRLERSHKENKTYANSKEFLSRITKDDRLIPVITIVVFLNNTHWDGPKSLHEMLHIKSLPKDLIKRIPDYKLIIVSPNLLEKQDLEKMTSTAGYVLGAIKHSYSGEKLKSFIEQNKKIMKNLPSYAAAVINEFCSMKIKEDELKKEVVDMCQAVIDIKTEGLEEGRAEGHAEGRKDEREEIIRNAFRKGYTPEQIAEFTGAELEEVLKVQGKMLQEIS